MGRLLLLWLATFGGFPRLQFRKTLVEVLEDLVEALREALLAGLENSLAQVWREISELLRSGAGALKLTNTTGASDEA